MKQKLLNLFTWRATLLVALLCTSFGNAWGQTTSTLTFTASNNVLQTNDGISWSTSQNKTEWSNDDPNVLTSSSITGMVKEVVVTAHTGNKNCHYKITVNVGDNDFGTKTDLGSNSSTSTSFNVSNAVYVNNKQIEISIQRTSQNKKITLESVEVTYVSKATIPAPGALDKDANPAKYYGTYSNKCQFVVPSGLTVSKVSVSSGTLAVTDLSGTIPANTGVMISAGNNQNSYTVDLKLATVSAISNNMLKPTGDNGITEEAMRATGSAFYYLTINPENDQIGFYRRNEDGDAFAMPANKAYLAISSTGVKGYSLNDVVNGIKAVEATETENKAIYNLAGQRVSKMQKGIYVVNGKKMIRR